MATRTVRLDEEQEGKLDEVKRRTGLTASAVLKKGLDEVHRQLARRPTFWEAYKDLDLGPGGYAKGPATEVKRVVKEAIRKKLGR